MFQPRPGLGDLIWHLPLIRAIAAASRDERVTLITKPSTQADIVLRGDPAIERIMWFDRNPRGHEGQKAGRHDGLLGHWRLVATLRECRAESCVLLHHGASLAAAVMLAGVRSRYGYGYDRTQRVWLNRQPFLRGQVQFAEAFDQAAAYGEAAGLGRLPEPSLTFDPEARSRLLPRLAGMAAPLAVLGVGCHGAQRQWGASRYGALAAALRERGFGSVLVLAGAHEAGLAGAVAAAAGPSAGIAQAVGWKLDEVVALLSAAQLFVGNDSGLMNVRAALQRPAYALFGASGPLRHSTWIRPVVPAQGARTGMDGIALGQVLEAIAAS